ncbi:unnamed protein product [Didymodactylos carnosus]|uniref:G-protein coupled receptors family 1 profile domain-containing protein n=1 Tax=Didymodactylos carnosus TaxID=1234261 RepID=A0A816AQW3_9BILA|nr:unnamed protein product [Didymodactylos carnosus]CAF1600778.1 unnamed protein product [Didymodactylos carnosus]CAF4331616.1 unnamed protein product [Didymodactylos carnosus]CAF4477716.1 unnamed protein product [Didymodactylos carnosus]
MLTTAEILNSVGHNFIIYFGSFVVISGIFGNLMNLCMFSQKPLRRRSFSHYIIALSVVNIIQVPNTLISRTLAEAFNIDPTLTNVKYCKFRNYSDFAGPLISLSLVCLASSDRCMSTSRSSAYRELSTIKISRRLILITYLFWLIHNIPFLVYFNINHLASNHSVCSSTSVLWANYISYFIIPILYCVLPITLLTSLGFKTYKNINTLQRRQRKTDVQLTSMILIQTIIVVLSTTPYCVFSIYAASTKYLVKDAVRTSQDALLEKLTRYVFLTNFASGFYSYIFSSKAYRKQIRSAFKILCQCRRANRVNSLKKNTM